MIFEPQFLKNKFTAIADLENILSNFNVLFLTTLTLGWLSIGIINVETQKIPSEIQSKLFAITVDGPSCFIVFKSLNIEFLRKNWSFGRQLYFINLDFLFAEWKPEYWKIQRLFNGISFSLFISICNLSVFHFPNWKLPQTQMEFDCHCLNFYCDVLFKDDKYFKR